MNIFNLLKKKDNSSYQEATKRLAGVKEKLEQAKSITFKEIYITEIHF